MAKLWELLDQAYYLIGSNRFSDAQKILEQILNEDPQNLDAWNAYIRICTTRNDLEHLRKHVVQIWETRVRDHDYLQAQQRFVLQRLDEKLDTL